MNDKYECAVDKIKKNLGFGVITSMVFRKCKQIHLFNKLHVKRPVCLLVHSDQGFLF